MSEKQTILKGSFLEMLEELHIENKHRLNMWPAGHKEWIRKNLSPEVAEIAIKNSEDYIKSLTN